MKLITIIKPSVIEGTGTSKSAKARISENMSYSRACFSYGTTGNAYKDKDGNVLAYSFEVYKRGKHKGHPKYKAFIYRIPQYWLLANKKEVDQRARNFVIRDKRR